MHASPMGVCARALTVARARLFMVALGVVVWSTTLPAASISAGAEICNGLFGSVERPVLACAAGDPGGGGVTVIGGSGAGSGINVPFRVDADNAEFSGTAAALQDYGVFRAYAALHVVEQRPGTFGGVYRARAYGEFQDTWTITGASGQGRLDLAFTVSGSAAADLFVLGANGREGASADLAIGLSLNNVFGGTVSGVTSPGVYPLVANGPNALVFTFGTPFQVSVLSVVAVGGGYDRNDPPQFFQLDGHASFEHTAILSGIAVTDMFGNPIPGFVLSAASGTQYPLAVAPVPLPAPGALLVGALLALLRTRGTTPRRGARGSHRAWFQG